MAAPSKADVSTATTHELIFIPLGWPCKGHGSLEIVYEGAERQLLFKDGAGEAIERKPIKGVSVEDLLGEELEPYVSLPYAFQPRLPFSLAEQGVIRVCETMAA